MKVVEGAGFICVGFGAILVDWLFVFGFKSLLGC